MASIARIFRGRSFNFGQLYGFADRALDEFTTYAAFDNTLASVVPIVDPATKNLTSYWLDGYTGAPWAGTASRGTSGSKSLVAGGAGGPTASTALNTRVGVQFNGTSQSLVDSAPYAADSYISENGYYYAFVCKPSSSPTFNGPSQPPSSGGYGTIFGDQNENFGIAYAGGVFYAFQYGSGTAWSGPVAPAAVNVEHFVEVWYDGTSLHLRVDNVEAKPVVISNTWMGTYLTGMVVEWGRQGTPLYYAGGLRAFMSAQGNFSQSERDGFAEFFKARYALDFEITNAPTSVAITSTAWNALHVTSYVSGSWAATASPGGGSGTNGALTTYNAAPAVGPPQAGVASADLAGASNQDLQGVNGDTYINGTAGVFVALIAMKTFAAPEAFGDFYKDARVIGDAGNNYSLTVSSAGIRGSIFDGTAWVYTDPIPIPVGRYVYVQMTWTATYLKIRVNAGRWRGVYCTGADPARTNTVLLVGNSGSGFANLDAQLVTVGVARTKTDATISGVGLGLQTTFGMDFGFASGLNSYTMAATTAAFVTAFKPNGLLAGRKLTATTRTHTLTGSASGLLRGKKLSATVGAFTETGSVAGLKAGKTIAISVGAIVESGSAAGLIASKKIAATVAAFVESGGTTSFLLGRKLSTTVGAFVETGNATFFTRAKRMIAAVGTFAETGITTGLYVGRKMSTTVGVFTETGNLVTLLRGRKLVAIVGAFVETGSAAAFTKTRNMITTVGAFSLIANTTALKAGRKLPVTVGAFTETGSLAAFFNQRKLATAVGVFTETGNAATLTTSHKIATAVGAFVETRNTANLRATRNLACVVGVFTFAGQAVGMVRAVNVTMAVSTAAFVLSGKAVNFARSRKIALSNGAFALAGSQTNFGVKMPATLRTFAVAGTATGLLPQRKLVAATQPFAINGYAAGLRTARKLSAAVAAFLRASAPVTLGAAHQISASMGAFTAAGPDAGLKTAHKIAAETTVFDVAGGVAEWVVVHTLATQPGTFDVATFDSGLLDTRTILAETGIFTLDGSDAIITEHFPTNSTLFCSTTTYHVAGSAVGHQISYRVRLITAATPGAVILFEDGAAASIELTDVPGAVINMSYGRFYDVGDIMEVSGEIRRRGATGQLLDPDTLTVWVQPPVGDLYSLVYGVASNVYRDSLGKYRARINVSSAGVGDWVVVFRATGDDAQATAPRLLTVREPAIIIPGL